MFMMVVKVKVKKGEEYIGFHVDDRENLIAYLEQFIEELKDEDNENL